jgi:hypothetical protein
MRRLRKVLENISPRRIKINSPKIEERIMTRSRKSKAI